MTNRELQALKTREKVYNCALKVIREQSFEKTSIKAITKEAGVSIGTFYTYFSSKEHVILYTYDENEIFYQDAYKKAKNLPFPESLLSFIEISYTSIENRGLEILKALLNNLLSAEFQARSTDKTRALYTSLFSILKTAQDNHQIASDVDVDFYVEQIVTMLNGVELTWCLTTPQNSKLSDNAVTGVKILMSDILNPGKK